jgi:ABC-type transport system involved in cytochrome c biogenesis permease subunit
MATNVLSNDPYLSPGDRRPRPSARTENSWEAVLRPLASLKLTVVLFALAIFLVFAGTVAQVDQDVWGVVHHYFRSFVAWIDFRIFFPREWQIKGGFPYPGGWLIGALLIVNLLAAHGLRFKVQAHGNRLVAGLAVIAAGIAVTWFVIHGVGAADATALWNGMKLGLAALLGVTVYSLVTLDWARKLEVGLLSAAAVVEGSVLGFLLFRSDFVPDPSAMRILWQLVEGGFAGAVLLAGCVLAFKRRGAIVLIHAGVALMMLNELYVGMTAEEAQMRLKPGAVQNYVDDIRTVELAVIDSSGKKKDDVIVIPKQMLQSKETIHDERLPFDVKVVEFMQNSDIVKPSKDKVNSATAGVGLDWIAESRPPVTGADTDSKVDISSAYITLLEKKTERPLGTYLVSLALMNELQPVRVDGIDYGVDLRFKRTYKDYVVKLLDANQVNYPGTTMARSFSSDIHLIDPSNRTDVTHHIWMNNPLRYKGDTFYQSGFDPRPGQKESTLSVVANRGWMIPYIGCMIVAVGLLAHFLTVLTRFLRRRSSGSLEPRADTDSSVPLAELAGDSRPIPPWQRTARDFFPWIAVAVLAGWALGHAIPPRPSPDTMNLYEFGQLPVLYEGRVKPFDSLARNALKDISERQTWVDSEGHPHSAIEWLLELMTDPKAAAKEPVFRIENAELRDILRSGVMKSKSADKMTGKTADENAGRLAADVADKSAAKADGEKLDTAAAKAPEDILEERPGLRYSLSEFRDGLEEFEKQREKASDVKSSDRNAIERQIIELSGRLNTYFAIENSFKKVPFPPVPTKAEIEADPEAAKAKMLEIADRLEQFHSSLAGLQVPLSVPPTTADGDWQAFNEADAIADIQQKVHFPNVNPNALSLAAILRAYQKDDAKAFNSEVAKYRESLTKSPSKLLVENRTAGLSIVAMVCQKLGLVDHADKLDFEAFFNHFEPFYYGLVLYLIAFILTCIALLGWTVPLNRAAFWLVVATLVLHTFAMIGRIYISGRPPVTSLYSAALFIGWAGVAIGLILELVYGMGIGTMLAGIAGFLTLVIAHFLATSGDTFTMVEAVLDTQFWLATHVTCITLGYATTFFAGLIGIRYVVQGVLTRSLPAAESKAMVRMIYGVLCFAIFFSFVGTVLGGLWADDSWGRFWGWDPKENGALIIVIWNALVLHARWDGMVKDRGLAVLSIGGIIAVAWSGFGVNLLSVGLHNYGFMHGVALWVAVTVGVSLALIGLGSTPKHLWRSFREKPNDAIA